MTEKARIIFYIDQERKEELNKIADREGRSVSNLVAYLVKQYIEHEHEHEQGSK